MSDQQHIEKLSGLQAHSCTCSQCKDMCRQTPCIGTPQDILKLVNAGFVDKLEPTILDSIASQNNLPDIFMVQPKFDEQRGCCSFFTDDALCSLHDLELKPTEGKLATHNVQHADMENIFPLPWLVAATWAQPGYLKTIKLILSALKKKRICQTEK